jgi:hypothetical protein
MNILKQISHFFAMDVQDDTFQIQDISTLCILDITCIDYAHGLVGIGTKTGLVLLGKIQIVVPMDCVHHVVFSQGYVIASTETGMVLYNLSDMSSLFVPFVDIVGIGVLASSPWLAIAQDQRVVAMDLFSSMGY